MRMRIGKLRQETGKSAQGSAGRGFTLLEVMIATAIIAIGAMTVQLAVLESIRSNKVSKDVTSMVSVIEGWAERLQGIPRTQATAMFGVWPANMCQTAGSDFINLIDVDETQPNVGAPGFQVLMVPKMTQTPLDPADGGLGVIVAYDLEAYCPAWRRSTGGSLQGTANTYRLTGKAFLVRNVAAGAGNYEILSSHAVGVMFSDRPAPIF